MISALSLALLLLTGLGCTPGINGGNTFSVKPDDARPLTRASEREKKLPFGLYITPSNTPIDPPENFTGYHTGRDFEIFPSEKETDVPVNAICSGAVVYSGRIPGYGGVIVESCTIGGEAVTVLYGHLDQESFTHGVNDPLPLGEQLAILGDDHSTETDGARKHLHLGIHKGTALEFRGYVDKKEELDAWLDPDVVLGQQ